MAKFTEPSILKEINDFSDCEVALFTTFSFDIPFFNRSIISLVLRKKARVCAFVDSKQLQKALDESYCDTVIGNYYYVQPFAIAGSFHPKVILLLGKNKAKLIVSSANLTFSGYYSNNELFQSFSYDEKDEQYLALMKQAFTFFKQLAQEANDDYIHELIDYINKNYLFLQRENIKSLPRLLTSYSVSLMRQIINIVGNNVKTIRVAVPFYDDDLTALTTFKKEFNNPEICLYIQNDRSTFPKEKYSEALINKVTVFDEVNNNSYTQKRFYHGKIFNFITDTKEYILYGSANFTNSALIRSHEIGNGNIEASIIDEGELGSFDNIFSSFIPSTSRINDLNTRPKEGDKDCSEEIASFIKGSIDESGLFSLLIKSKIYPEKIKIDDKDVTLLSVKEGSNNQYTICFIGEMMTNVFDLEISSGDQVVKIKCLVNNIKSISTYLRSSSRNPYKSIDEKNIEKYKKEDFVKHFEMLTNDIRVGIEEQKRIKVDPSSEINDDTVEQETSEEEEELDSSSYDDSGFFVPIGSREIYGKVTAYLDYFVDKTDKILRGKKPRTKGDDDDGQDEGDDDNQSTSTTKNGDENSARERHQSASNFLLKYFISFGSISNHHFDDFDFEHLFKIYVLFAETYIWDMYIEKNNKIDIEKLINAKIDFLINRIIPVIDGQAERSELFPHFKKQVALLCLECHGYQSNSIFSFKDELIKMDKFFNSTFLEEVSSLMTEVGSVLEINKLRLTIDDIKHTLFDAPNEEELKKALNKYFGFETSEIDTSLSNQSCLEINIKSFVKAKTFGNGKQNLDFNVINKIFKYIERYYENKGDVYYSFQISINNYNDYISKIVFKCIQNKCREFKIARAYRPSDTLSEFKTIKI